MTDERQGHVRIITMPENTIDYKIGYHHGATGRQPLPYQPSAYRDGFAEGFIARREAKS